ncbi:hypothetical protein Rhopal_005083-T1 [Rhodotorula paludigena]|uniref:Maintenance of mitochondrial morphology protein 1 n=1 Tax=Rhodotorula paludigena TaxID=86838 RepID=A0AAV5GRD3_9BASI|nr:hypothetical protein Rhopal_005083-T1 [Rhodotorula paludigena]
MAGMAAAHTALPAMQQQQPAPLQVQAPLFSFTQGVLLGQASMIILAALFLKYVVFEDPEAARRVRQERKRARQEEAAGAGPEDGEGGERKKKDRKGKKAASRTPPDFPAATLSAASLLSSLSYDLSSHAPESLDWLNVLLAQLISSYRLLAASHSAGGARQLVEEALNRRTGGTEEGAEASQGMVGLDFIGVDEVELGDGFPALSAARVRPSGMGGESVRVELDLDYSDQVLLAVSTRVVLNFPRPRFAVLPVSLSVTLERFSGTLTVELPPPVPAAADPSDPHQHHHAHPTLHLSLHPDFELQLATLSLLGSRAKLQDVPKVEQLLGARIRAAIQDRIVWPGRIEIALPGVKPHHHRHAHRHGEDSEPVAPLADDLAASPLSGATSPLSDPLFPHTPPSPSSPLAATSPLHFSAPLPQNPLLARTQSAASSFTNGTGTPETPSVDLSAPEGPSIALHPRVRPAPPATAAQAQAQAGATPSPSECLPGYFPPGAAELNGLAEKRVGGSAPGAAGMRYRTTAGAAAGVGIGVGVGT